MCDHQIVLSLAVLIAVVAAAPQQQYAGAAAAPVVPIVASTFDDKGDGTYNFS